MILQAFSWLFIRELEDEELPNVVHRNSAAIKVDYVPLRKKKGFPSCFKVANRDKDDTFVPTRKKNREYDNILSVRLARKRGRPAGSKPAKRKMEQKRARKPALVDDIHNSDLTGDTETKRKKGGAASSKPVKIRMEQKMARKPALVDDIHDSALTSDAEAKVKLPGEFPASPSRKRGAPTGFRSAKRRMGRKIARKPALVDDILGSDLTSDTEEEKVKLPGEYPSFTKSMLKSHVVKGFWLGLPGSFCTEHLPKKNDLITLEDEHGESYDTNYLHNSKALSAGWGGFARKHNLRVGDDVVFRLVLKKKFKVYILRGGAPGFDTPKENSIQNEAEGSDHGVISKEHPKVIITKDNNPASGNHGNKNVSGEAAGNDKDDPGTDLGCVENFNVVIDGSVIDLPDDLRRRYYGICCARKAVLHRNLFETNDKLATRVIMETSNIAECVMAPLLAAASSSSHEDLTVWKKTLEFLELLGMDVAFLCRRVDDLLAIHAARSSTVRVYSRRRCRN
ncbi:B3 domain-containing protein Os01g0234100-like [Triticum aestivum]|uniref:B3 domain-containing protein Os01g0234100-like n=1 Tax=Triticum aestivum TaxID=4565 RepID=UPI001D024427|nr:B3 domain-containing protein Os01g0234100-like [Triticum aestivum]